MSSDRSASDGAPARARAMRRRASARCSAASGGRPATPRPARQRRIEEAPRHREQLVAERVAQVHQQALPRVSAARASSARSIDASTAPSRPLRERLWSADPPTSRSLAEARS